MDKKLLLIFLGFLILYLIKSLVTTDPDFGWYLYSGQYFLSNGIPNSDPFSYTMPSYPWTDHQWLSDIIFYKLFSIGGSALLGIFLVLFFLPVPILLLGKNLSSRFITLPLVITLSVFFSFWSLRPQIISWVLYSLLIFLIFNSKLWQKFRFAIPIMFVIWANLHGAFALGLVTLTFYVMYIFLKKQADLFDLIILILSILATFINPYGARIYFEVFNTFFSSGLRNYVGEWSSVFPNINLTYFALILISTAIIWKFRKIFNYFELSLFVFLLILGISSIKQIPFFALVSLVLTAKAVECLNKKVSKNPIQKLRFEKVFQILIFATIALLIINIYKDVQFLKANYINRYPDKAITYLKTHPSQGELFSMFNWASYVGWNYPEKKVFIDGRMSIWNWQQSNPNELDNALDTYIKIVYSQTDFDPTFEKLNVDTVLYADVENSDFLKELEIKNWKKVYSDGIAVIYRRI